MNEQDAEKYLHQFSGGNPIGLPPEQHHY